MRRDTGYGFAFFRYVTQTFRENFCRCGVCYNYVAMRFYILNQREKHHG